MTTKRKWHSVGVLTVDLFSLHVYFDSAFVKLKSIYGYRASDMFGQARDQNENFIFSSV